MDHTGPGEPTGNTRTCAAAPGVNPPEKTAGRAASLETSGRGRAGDGPVDAARSGFGRPARHLPAPRREPRDRKGDGTRDRKGDGTRDRKGDGTRGLMSDRPNARESEGPTARKGDGPNARESGRPEGPRPVARSLPRAPSRPLTPPRTPPDARP
ncbi:hypothetical protein GCM10018791_19540 [Streptomyces zaomyceticus]|nr:hypothetical protein GCM10018791_19540 [Streptomyces zaomyceticus]